MEIKKAIIPVAGYGTRRLPITKAIEKNMLPIGDRPIVDYVVEECIKAGIEEIFFVINNSGHSQIKDYYNENATLTEYLKARKANEKLAKLETAPKNIKFHYVEQDVNEKYGTAIPVALAMNKFNFNEPVVFCNGDDPFWNAKDGSDVKTMTDAMTGEMIMMGYKVKKEDMPKYGMMIAKDNYLTGIIEKPKPEEVTSDLANLNRLVMTPKFMSMVVDYVETKNFGPLDQEYYITDVYGDYLKDGNKIKVVGSTGEWLDCGSLEGWLHANDMIARKK